MQDNCSLSLYFNFWLRLKVSILVFKFIEVSLNKLLDAWDRYNSFLVLGEGKIGKTTYLSELSKKICSNDSYILKLDGYSEYQSSYAPFQLSVLNSGSKHVQVKKLSENIVDDVTKDTRFPFKSLVNLLINQGEVRRNSKLLTLNDTEKRIISQICMVAKNKKLIIIADDYNYWDEKSCNLLSFLMTKEAKNSLPFLSNVKLVISSISSPTNLIIDYTAELQPSTAYRAFVSQIEVVAPGYDDLFYEQLYSITGGNLGQAKEISEFYELSKFKFSKHKIQNPTLTGNILKNVLKERVIAIAKNNSNFTPTMESASVLGKQFEVKFLQIFENVSFSQVIENLSVADQHKLIKKCTVMHNSYEFYDALIHAFFYDMPDFRKKEYHRKFAQLFENLQQFDYYKRYYHLYHAGLRERAYELFSIHLLRQRQKKIPIAAEHEQLLSKEGGKYYESFSALDSALSSVNLKKAEVYLQSVDASYGYLTLLERDYIYAMIVSHNGISSEYENVYKMLSEYFFELRENYFEQWIRFGIFLLSFCVNRICNHKQAKEIEKTLILELSKKCHEDIHWEILAHILNRNSSALYNTEIALIKVKRSYDFFLSQSNECLENYVFAAINYSGLLIVASEYQKAYEYSKNCLYDLSERNIFFYNIEKLLNNHIVSGYLAGEFTALDSIALFDKALEYEELMSKPLIANNYHLLAMYSGDIQKSLNFFLEYYDCNKVRNHNDYYRYLYSINCVSILIATNQYDRASIIHKTFHNHIPAIMKNEEAALHTRYETFERIIKERNSFGAVSEFEELFKLYCGETRHDYYSRPFIFSDQQVWSIV